MLKKPMKYGLFHHPKSGRIIAASQSGLNERGSHDFEGFWPFELASSSPKRRLRDRAAKPRKPWGDFAEIADSPFERSVAHAASFARSGDVGDIAPHLGRATSPHFACH